MPRLRENARPKGRPASCHLPQSGWRAGCGRKNVSRKVRQVRQGSGRRAVKSTTTRTSRMPLRGLRWLGGGKNSTLKTMKTASRTWKEGGKRMSSRGAGVPPAWRLKSGKQAKRPMFSIISHPGARLEAAPPEVPRCLFRRSRTASGGAASCRAEGRMRGRKAAPQTRHTHLVTPHCAPEGATAAGEACVGGGGRARFGAFLKQHLETTDFYTDNPTKHFLA